MDPQITERDDFIRETSSVIQDHLEMGHLEKKYDAEDSNIETSRSTNRKHGRIIPLRTFMANQR